MLKIIYVYNYITKNNYNNKEFNIKNNNVI